MDEITLTRAEPPLGPAQQGPASYRPDISLSEEKGDSGLVQANTVWWTRAEPSGYSWNTLTCSVSGFGA